MRGFAATKICYLRVHAREPYGGTHMFEEGFSGVTDCMAERDAAMIVQRKVAA